MNNDAEVTISSVVGGVGGYTFTWYKDNTPIAYSRNISQITGGNYSVTIGNGICSSNFPVIVPLTSKHIDHINFALINIFYSSTHCLCCDK